MHAVIRNELFCSMPTRVGALADVTGALASAGVNIEAIGAYDKDGRGEFMMIVSDNAAGAEALRALGADVAEKSVVTLEVENRPGALAEAAAVIAEAGINVGWVYATTGEGTTTIVLRTADNERVVEVLG
jgi:hypothetical protein